MPRRIFLQSLHSFLSFVLISLELGLGYEVFALTKLHFLSHRHRYWYLEPVQDTCSAKLTHAHWISRVHEDGALAQRDQTCSNPHSTRASLEGQTWFPAVFRRFDQWQDRKHGRAKLSRFDWQRWPWNEFGKLHQNATSNFLHFSTLEQHIQSKNNSFSLFFPHPPVFCDGNLSVSIPSPPAVTAR